jgi:hypothetical protein
METAQQPRFAESVFYFIIIMMNYKKLKIEQHEP